jgi:hypothetical protein
VRHGQASALIVGGRPSDLLDASTKSSSESSSSTTKDDDDSPKATFSFEDHFADDFTRPAAGRAYLSRSAPLLRGAERYRFSRGEVALPPTLVRERGIAVIRW